ncbi:caspase family protein [Aetokthonos hydrillicola Thurmond2011]|jgi:hypothetical protein|uniref:Caspase family protein n=1 Tax=Aetokthonos hydrillicola Thurmond2011 TaxID=2712845 RepID=A0AAP5I741_9CYAN|nr:caspase family protein [Aetokthonos hydrillicola]MBO3460647.1 caspase family protein [Aetokthonos hydrillicola CCALA 1050]MBW4587771.1 caspase family protein [Aetokthonos hydrillicola CCALA 1050]MDR9894418.1 caspase family protein [Aetokthonos hydrillicola Thurmond2011]
MSIEQIGVKTGSSFWALLIGIDIYQTEKNLRGCVNDVTAMRVFLINQLGVPEDHIRTLTNQEATRANILQTFQEFLINNLAIQVNDQILLHYSGHGSQIRDVTGIEPDGYNETLVPHDSRTPGVYDIPDKTLAALLDRLVENKGDYVTVILDSCHSGSGTRDIEGLSIALSRQVPPDERIPPTDLDTNILTGTAIRTIGSSGWFRPKMSHILLAGCRDRQMSNEYWAKSEEQEGVWHGAMTFFTLQALSQMAPGTTYAELYERVAAQVNGIYPNQMPQCEGDRERVIFGNIRVQQDPFITVREVMGDIVTLGAGLVHGLHQGTRLALYPAEVRTHDSLPATPVTTVEVFKVWATTAHARSLFALEELIPLHARGLITEQVYIGLRQIVTLKAIEGEINQQAITHLYKAIQQATPDQKPSPHLKVLDDSSQIADLHVIATDGTLSIYNSNGELLVIPDKIQNQGEDSAIAARHCLENIARYRQILNLINSEPGSQLAGKVKVRLRRYLSNLKPYELQDLLDETTRTGGEVNLYYNAKDKDQNEYVVEVINNSLVPIYPHVFIMNPDYSIYRLYPAVGQEEALCPQQTLISGLPGSGGYRLSFYLPDEPRWNICRDYLKVIVTTTPSDLRWLEQRGLNIAPPGRRSARSISSYLEQLLDILLYDTGTRFGHPASNIYQEDWTTLETPLTIVRT